MYVEEMKGRGSFFLFLIPCPERKEKKADQDAIIPCLIEETGVSPEKRKAWARLIQKIYEIDPLTCPTCQGSMKIINFIEQEEVIKKILKHLGLWEVTGRTPHQLIV